MWSELRLTALYQYEDLMCTVKFMAKREQMEQDALKPGKPGPQV